MLRLGFACTPLRDSSFHGTFGQRVHVDFLYCDRKTTGVVYRRWQAAVVHKQGRVLDVDVSVGLTGP